MGSAEASYLEEIVKRESGIVIARDKGYLLETRLLPVAFRHGLDGLAAMAVKLQATNDRDLLREVVEAMAASETAFFRDYVPFQKLKHEILPKLLRARAGDKTLRIWSAGCGTGQEPYSVAMLLQESGLPLKDWKIEILAADISQEALAYALTASYTQLEVQRGLPAHCLVKYFAQGEDQRWLVAPQVKDMVQFSQLNLVAGPAPVAGCDLILCRYVLPHFEPPTQQAVLRFLRPALRDDGVLMLGLNESVTNIFGVIDAAAGIFGAANIA